jgi:hypothetical protein
VPHIFSHPNKPQEIWRPKLRLHGPTVRNQVVEAGKATSRGRRVKRGGGKRRGIGCAEAGEEHDVTLSRIRHNNPCLLRDFRKFAFNFEWYFKNFFYPVRFRAMDMLFPVPSVLFYRFWYFKNFYFSHNFFIFTLQKGAGLQSSSSNAFRPISFSFHRFS